MKQANLYSLILYNYLRNLINYQQLSTLSLYQSSTNLEKIFNSNNTENSNENITKENNAVIPLQTEQSSISHNQISVSIDNNQSFPSNPSPTLDKVKSRRRRNKKRRSFRLTKCPHKGAKHYAKNMCSSCYHSKGRSKRAWKCEHTDQAHYALGVCQVCYQANYFLKKKQIESNK